VPFGNLLVFLFKWALAGVIVGVVFYVFWWIVSGAFRV
jgi:hypothetical protein